MDIFSLDWNYILTHYGAGTAFFLYFVWKEVIPAMHRYLPKLVKSNVEAQKQATQLQAEREAREEDMKERSIIALEMIGKEMAVQNQTMAVMKEQFTTFQRTQEATLAANHSMIGTLGVLLERSERKREDYEHRKGGELRKL